MWPGRHSSACLACTELQGTVRRDGRRCPRVCCLRWCRLQAGDMKKLCAVHRGEWKVCTLHVAYCNTCSCKAQGCSQLQRGRHRYKVFRPHTGPHTRKAAQQRAPLAARGNSKRHARDRLPSPLSSHLSGPLLIAIRIAWAQGDYGRLCSARQPPRPACTRRLCTVYISELACTMPAVLPQYLRPAPASPGHRQVAAADQHPLRRAVLVVALA